MHLIGLSASNVKDIREVFQITITEICAHLHWPVGFAYIVEAPGRLHGISAWYCTDGARYEDLHRVTATIDFSLKDSLIGQVLKNGKTVFVDDIQNSDSFLRKDAAKKASLTSCIAMPVIVNNRVAAIMEFFRTEPVKPQESELEVMDVIAVHLGQVIEQRRTEKKLQVLFDSAPDAQIVTDTFGKIVMANKQTANLFGYAQDLLIGQPVEVLIPPNVRTDHVEHRRRYIAAPHPRPMGVGIELPALRRDGTAFPAEVSLSPVESEDGLLIAAAIRDVRERKRLESELRAKERLAEMGTMAAVFAHEAADPMQGISVCAQFLEESLPAEYETQISGLKEEISRLGSLLNDFRSFSRLEELKLTSVDLTNLMQEVVKKNTSAWAISGIRVVTEFARRIMLTGDSEKLQQVIGNLCRNAVQSMSPGGTLTLRTFTIGEDAVLEVSDTGTGIPAGIDIFAPFTTTKAQGTGIGLHVVQRIVSAHGGTVTYSTNQGKGTTFRVTLPSKTNKKV